MPIAHQKSALLIAGPTASGKSALALRLARQRNGVIINADSMQVYRDLRILTARPSQEEESRVPHRLYGHASAAEPYSAGRWLKDALREMDECWRMGLLPIICGGTGLYFRALEQGLAELPPIPMEIRERWRRPGLDLHGELLRRDPGAAGRLKPGDTQRLVRALEVIEATGRPLASWQGEEQSTPLSREIAVERLFLEAGRHELYERAERRFDYMMASGALDEVRALPPLPPHAPLLKAIGVPELHSHLRGEISLERAVADAKTATRHYIKRQFTWWRKRSSDWRSVTLA